jgi:quercetin dioxygenase-like cupin family protein
VGNRRNETFDLGQTRLSVVVATEAASVLEAELDPGAGAGWHTHTREDETVLVLEGEIVVHDGERHDLVAGDAYVLPRGTRHAFANEADSRARVYFVCTPGGLERFFRAVTTGVPPDEAAADAGLEFE